MDRLVQDGLRENFLKIELIDTLIGKFFNYTNTLTNNKKRCGC